jgi:hypothetical protein
MSDTAPGDDNTTTPDPHADEVVDFATIEIVHAADRLVIDVDDALRGLREARDEKGADYIYQKPDPSHNVCVYCWEIDGQMQPRCIVGVALAKLGVPPKLMYQLANDLSIHALAECLRHRGYNITTDAVYVMRAAQCVQDAALGEESRRPPDEKVTWGAAVAAAEREAERLKERAAKQQEKNGEGETPTAPAE